MYLIFDFFRNGRRISIFFFLYLPKSSSRSWSHILNFVVTKFYRTKILNMKFSPSIYFELLVEKKKCSHKFLIWVLCLMKFHIYIPKFSSWYLSCNNITNHISIFFLREQFTVTPRHQACIPVHFILI